MSVTSTTATAFIYVRDDIWRARTGNNEDVWRTVAAGDPRVALRGGVALRVGSQYRFYPVCGGHVAWGRPELVPSPPPDPIVLRC